MLASFNQSNPMFRRMRREEHMREFIAEQHISPHDLCHPIFIRNDISHATPVENLPNISYFPVDEAIDEIKAVRDMGVKHFVIRPRPDKTIADNPKAVMQFEAGVIERIATACPDVTKIIDGYFGMARTNGYYGVVDKYGKVNLEESLRELTEHAVIQGNAGADIVVSLGRLDKAVGSIRTGLDAASLQDVAILAYSINFGSTLAHAMLDDTPMAKNAYSQTIRSKIGVGNIDEALRQTAVEIAEGADYIGVKPASIFLDAISRVKQQFNVPIATYIVSKEYCMVKAAAERGWINERDTVMEYMLSMKRAGADKIFNYWVRDMIQWLKELS